LRRAIDRALGDGNRDAARIKNVFIEGLTVTVQWSINDNFTDGMIKRGARLDVKNMLQELAGTDQPFSMVNFSGWFSLSDQLGRSSEEEVLRLSYSFDTVRQINFDNF